MQRELIPAWHLHKHLDEVKKSIMTKGEYVCDWNITKPSMIATLNYFRKHGLKCDWIEKGESQFYIKVVNK